MVKYFRDFQTLLQKISDYLPDKIKWWDEEEFGIRFLNIRKCSSSKKVNHFRSSSIKAEKELVKDCWQKCLDNRDKSIPAYKIIVSNRDVLLQETLDFFLVNRLLRMFQINLAIIYQIQHLIVTPQT